MSDYILDDDEQFDLDHAAYASFGTRLLASIIDSLVTTVVLFVFSFFLIFVVGEGSILFMILYYPVSLVGPWLYSALLESSPNQATLGKQAMNIIVVNERGERITFGQATGRHFGKFLSGLILFIGYIMAAFDGRKQALHDKLAKTYVVH